MPGTAGKEVSRTLGYIYSRAFLVTSFRLCAASVSLSQKYRLCAVGDSSLLARRSKGGVHSAVYLLDENLVLEAFHGAFVFITKKQNTITARSIGIHAI